MQNFWLIIYNILFIPLLVTLLRIASLFNPKIARGISDRKKLFENLIINLTGLDRRKPMIWFHSSSLGEFEQAKPIIKKLRAERDVNIIITFFSPSGYRNSLNYPYADVISYLPLDTKFLAKRFIDLVKPTLAIFMRYDIWPNFCHTMKSKNIPMIIADATMQKNSSRLLPGLKSFHKNLYETFAQILTVSEEDLKNFRRFNLQGVKLATVGDTRFDRVSQKSIAARNLNLINENIIRGKKIFIFGSSWEADEEVVLPAVMKLLRYDSSAMMIIAPHEPTEPRLESLGNYFRNYQSVIRFSHLNNYKDERIILVDSIGILLSLYKYAHVAYVGGSFKQGIHNVIEPAVYGIPVLFGPKIQNSQEAVSLTKLGSGIVVPNKKKAYKTLRKLFTDETERKRLGEISKNFVESNLGASDKILLEIYKYC